MSTEVDNSQKKLRKIFSDISKGFSTCVYNGERCFIKHLSHHDQVLFDEVYEEFFQYAKKKGIPTYKEKLEYAIKEEESWSQEEEDWITKQTALVNTLRSNKDLMHLKKDIDNQNKLIEEESRKLNEKLNDKRDILGQTCEEYASSQINQHYIKESFFKDSNFKDKVFTEEEYEYLSPYDLKMAIFIYNKAVEDLSDGYIKLLSIQDFFQNYWSACDDDFHKFFGVPICNLTYFQLRLGSYAKLFKNIFERGISFPEDVRKDPDKIIEYVKVTENSQKKLERSDKDGAKSLVGATKEDYERLNLKPANDKFKKELSKKNNGKLEMHDLIKLMGS